MILRTWNRVAKSLLSVVVGLIWVYSFNSSIMFLIPIVMCTYLYITVSVSTSDIISIDANSVIREVANVRLKDSEYTLEISNGTELAEVFENFPKFKQTTEQSNTGKYKDLFDNYYLKSDYRKLSFKQYFKLLRNSLEYVEAFDIEFILNKNTKIKTIKGILNPVVIDSKMYYYVDNFMFDMDNDSTYRGLFESYKSIDVEMKIVYAVDSLQDLEGNTVVDKYKIIEMSRTNVTMNMEEN